MTAHPNRSRRSNPAANRATAPPPHDTAVSRWRARLGISQADAAKRLGLSKKSYQQHESGKCWKTGKPVRQTRVMRLALAAVEAGVEPVDICATAQ